MNHCGRLYLDLIKRCLVNSIYGDLVAIVAGEKQYHPSVHVEGWKAPPLIGHTMVGLKRLDNVQSCVEDVLAKQVPGDLLEAGVWRGGTTILMRAVLRAHEVKDRRVWVADSFEGVPPPNPARYPQDAGLNLHQFPGLAINLQTVQENFRRYGLLDDQVRFLKGWFRDTLPRAPIEKLAVIRLDGDLYESTMDGLANLYPKLSPGGYCIIDDYFNIEACRQAVHDYRERHSIQENIQPIDWSAVYWQRL